MAIVAAAAAMLGIGAYMVLRDVYRVADLWALVVSLLLAGAFGGGMSMTEEREGS